MYVLGQKSGISINAKAVLGFKVYPEDEQKWGIRTIFPYSEYTIAKYDTLQRAEEVLQKLMDYYSETERAIAYSMGNGYYVGRDYYFKMPEE